MKKPVFFDVDAEIAKVRTEMARMLPIAQGHAKTPRDLEFIACQEQLNPLILLALKINLEAQNNHVDPILFANALGSAMAQISASHVQYSGLNPAHILHPLVDILSSILSGEMPKEYVVEKINTTPIMGGNA